MLTAGVIRCRIGDEAYCFEMSSVVSVRQAITLLRPSLGTPGEPIGSVAVRGFSDVPVCSLSEVLGHPRAVFDVRHQHIVVLQTGHRVQGFLVDSVSRVFAVPADHIRPCPELLNHPARKLFKSAILLRDEHQVAAIHLLISPERLLQEASDPTSHNASAPADVPGFAINNSDRGVIGAARTVGQIVLFPIRETLFDGCELLCGLSATQVVEVLDAQPITHVPFAPMAVAGFVTWRERAVPVLRLGERLGIPGENEQSRTVIVRHGDDLLAIMISSHWKRRRVPLPHQSCSPPIEFDTTAILGTFRHESELVVVPNLARLTQPVVMSLSP